MSIRISLCLAIPAIRRYRMRASALVFLLLDLALAACFCQGDPPLLSNLIKNKLSKRNQGERSFSRISKGVVLHIRGGGAAMEDDKKTRIIAGLSEIADRCLLVPKDPIS